MRRRAAALFLCFALTLTGCGSGSIYSTFRAVEQMLVIHTIGIDKTPDGLELTIAAGKSGEGELVRMKAAGPTISAARDRLEDYASDEDLFFSHTNYFVLGKSALCSGVEPYLNYLERSAELRLDVPVFAMADGDAGELVLRGGNDKHSVTEALSSLERVLTLRGDGHVFTASEIAQSLSSYGAALVCAIKRAQAGSGVESAGKEELTALPAGYIILKDGAQAGSIAQTDARGVNLLLGYTGSGSIELDWETYTACVIMDRTKTCIEPVWNDGGALTGITVDITVRAELGEQKEPHAASPAYLAGLEASLEREAGEWVNHVLAASKALSADFLGIGGILERKSPEKFRAMGRDFAALLPELDFQVTVSSEISGSYYLSGPDDMEGGG